MPYYLAQVHEGASLADNILDLVLRPDGLLHEEARLLLDQELPDSSAYFSILRAIAAGQTRVAQIAQRTGISGGTSRVSQMLDLLRNLWLVEREHPVTVTNPERSRQRFYRITDPYLPFWFRFVLPAHGRLADDEGAERHLHGRVLPQLDEFVSAPAFEEVCQQRLRREVDAAAVGWWWGKVRETRGAGLRDVDRGLDAVAVDDDGRVTTLASCKWTAGPLPFSGRAKRPHPAGDAGRPVQSAKHRAAIDESALKTLYTATSGGRSLVSTGYPGPGPRVNGSRRLPGLRRSTAVPSRRRVRTHRCSPRRGRVSRWSSVGLRPPLRGG
jgi:hypothetical protein